MSDVDRKAQAWLRQMRALHRTIQVASDEIIDIGLSMNYLDDRDSLIGCLDTLDEWTAKVRKALDQTDPRQGEKP